ncbi:hypothetical protein Pyn_08037 [Prunus yedoensis var. nudiflora]|uniref:Uncharacterized protein n=1 Tax=Prunus yedoensis var. nudiflora TaxID=2094558 RepID=A0A314XPS8_PRUYE|nr:hypothetical protein Pyn_08037 [Prunus yedoensis var. nudiflora]
MGYEIFIWDFVEDWLSESESERNRSGNYEMAMGVDEGTQRSSGTKKKIRLTETGVKILSKGQNGTEKKETEHLNSYKISKRNTTTKSLTPWHTVFHHYK